MAEDGFKGRCLRVIPSVGGLETEEGICSSGDIEIDDLRESFEVWIIASISEIRL